MCVQEPCWKIQSRMCIIYCVYIHYVYVYIIMHLFTARRVCSIHYHQQNISVLYHWHLDSRVSGGTTGSGHTQLGEVYHTIRAGAAACQERTDGDLSEG